MSLLLWHFLLAFFAGVLLNFTPCVLPVLPIKIQILLKEIKSNLRSRIFSAMALFLGAVTFFALMASFIIYLGFHWGALFQSEIFLVCIAVILLCSAWATLFDWGFQIPKFAYQIPAQRYAGAYVTGALAAILSTPCSGPLLASVLAYTLTQSAHVIWLIYLSLALGLTFPYILLLMFPRLLDYFQFNNRWIRQVKHLFAFILVAGAIFFFQVLIDNTLIRDIIWWTYLAVLIIWIISQHVKALTPNEATLPFLSLIFLVTFFIINIQPKAHDTIQWKPYTSQALKEDVLLEQAALVLFTADWCLNCKILERTTYRNKHLIETMRRTSTQAYLIDMTSYNKPQKELLMHYGGNTLPYAVLINKDGVIKQEFTGMFHANSLVTAINN